MAARWPQHGNAGRRHLSRSQWRDLDGPCWHHRERGIHPIAALEFRRPPPFTGAYRQASVIHDYYCETRDRPWKDVHEAFYWASRAGGVGRTKANIMYFAVYRFGPRWEPVRADDPSEIVFKPRFVPEEFDAVRVRIERGDVDLGDLRGLAEAADRQLRSRSRSFIE